ncbi:nucleolar protein 14 [Glomus cerebriforme]|uniref:Nucleolar protein 14 n=1 Tax=Glomus cerebriforme TaxID=658196 RepID=A0A397TDV8_9GLOM|nr:nucleolar protein 14 [Glomus cerebriforme]
METVARSHFGGFEDTNNNDNEYKKSKNEIMKELIVKSKMHKYERQLEKDENEKVRQELDIELDSIRNLLIMPPKPRGEPLESQESAFRKQSGSIEVESKSDEKYEEYDKIVRELAFEKRARPTDRTKSEEEIALEEKEKLEKLELARKRRMEGLSSGSEDDVDKSKRKRQRRVPIADDLDDDYLTDNDDDDFGLGKGISLKNFATIGRIQEGESDEMNVDEEGNSQSEDSEDDEDKKDDDDDDDDDEKDKDETDFKDNEGQHQLLEDINDFSSGKLTPQTKNCVEFQVTKKSKEENNKSELALAYIFTCPSTMEEFLEIIKNVGDNDVPIVVHRIRIIHHIKLSPDNQEKLEKFFNILMDYIYIRIQEIPYQMHLINRLSLQIFDLVQQIPEHAIKYFIGKIDYLKNNLMKNYKFPKITELFLFKLLGKIFPTSDFHHNIITPTLLLIGQYLAQCQVINGKDLISGLFLCNLLYEYQALSRRIVPEALNFLFTTLVYLAPKNTFNNISSIPGTFPFSNSINSIPSTLQIKDGKKIETKLLNFSEILNRNVDNLDNDEFRVSVLLANLHIIELYAKLYNSTSAFIELFNSVLELLSSYPLDKFSESIKNKLMNTQEILRRLQKFSQQNKKPLQLQYHKPIPIPTYIPKFQENFSIDKHYDRDKERAKINKLKSQYKKEHKGAIRELRKDSQFIARQHINEIKEKDDIYKKKINKIKGILENEQSEKKAYEKAKKYGKL